jgi:transcriptional regulator with XRE-family HTH domain
MPSEQLSHRLVRYREQHGLTQADLAGVLGVTARYLSDLESGKKDIDTNGSLYKYFGAIENGLVPLNRQFGSKGSSVREVPFDYVGAVDSRRGETVSGLSQQDMLSQIRADLAMIEGGAQSEKRRAYNFLYSVHLPMLAKMLKLE